jgi:hypothetical protein
MPREPKSQPSDDALLALLDRDLAFGAMRRLQRRHTAIANVNEFFGALFAIVRGLGSLLAADDAERRNPESQRKRTEDRHG